MDALSPTPSEPPLAPPARIRRRAETQRPYLPRLEAHARALVDGALGHEGESLRRLGSLREALRRSPYYRRRLHEAHLSPDDLRDFADLSHFPTLSRAELAEHWEELPADFDDEPVLVRSSGTTGEPVSVLKSRYDCLHMWAVLRFWTRAFDLPARPRVVLLCALPGGLEYSVRLGAFFDGALHRISTVKPRLGERLAKANPSVLFTDPEGLHALRSSDVELPALKLALSSAQRLSPELRAAAEARLQTPLVDYYATTETGPIAWSCPLDGARFHVLSPDVHVERTAQGLAVTRLRESPLPLLRYLPGDEGTLSHGPCDCGVVGQTISGLHTGRSASFVRADGQRVDPWRLAFLFKTLPLRAFQLEQRGPTAFSLRTEPPRPELIGPVTRGLEALGFEGAKVTLGPLAPGTAAKCEPFLRREDSELKVRPQPA